MKNKKQILRAILASGVMFFLTPDHAYSTEDTVPDLGDVTHGKKRAYKEVVEEISQQENREDGRKPYGIKKRKKCQRDHTLKTNSSRRNNKLRSQLHDATKAYIHGENPPATKTDKDEAEPTYNLALGYYCHLDSVSYSDIGEIGITASNGQEFICKSWERGKVLSFKKYRTKIKGRLTISKSMLPLTLTVSLISSIQPLKILRDVIYNNSKNTPLSSLRTWAGEQPLTFILEESHLFDENEDLGISGLLINNLAPGNTTVIDLIKK